MRAVCCLMFVFTLCACRQAYAQRCDTVSYQSMYYVDEYSNLFPQKLFVKNGSIFISGLSSPTNTESGKGTEVMLMKLNDRGTPLWCKNIGNSGSPVQNFDQAEDAIQTSDGGFVLAGRSQSDNNPYSDAWLAKIDSNGAVVWSEVFISQASEIVKVIQLADGSFVAVGNELTNFEHRDLGNIGEVYNSQAYMAHIDKNGHLLWARSFFSKQLNNMRAVTQLRDGNLAVCGDTRDNSVITNPALPFLAKVDIGTGKFIWTTGYDYPATGGNIPTIIELPDKRLCIHDGSNVSYYSTDGTAIKTTSFIITGNSLEDAFIQYIGTTAPGEDCYFAFQNRHTYLFEVKNDSSVMWARKYSVGVLPGSFTEMCDVVIGADGFYLCSEIQTIDFPHTGSQYYAFFTKTDKEGRTPCSDTLSNPFIFLHAGLNDVNAPQFTDNGSPLSPYFRALRAENDAPYTAKDCYKFSCCNDTLLYRQALICNGSTFTLPAGAIATDAGVYPSAFKTVKGCDSIIYTTLTLQRPVKVSLGHDTCFAASDSIKYKLSFSEKIKLTWQDGSTDSAYTITQPGEYRVRVTGACNSFSDSVTVFKSCDFPVYIPNAFTPNHDGLNDVFRVAGLANQHLVYLSIYNRFGQRIFYTSDASKGWDGMINGAMQQTGAYIYIVRYKDVGGHLHDLKGTVVLIR